MKFSRPFKAGQRIRKLAGRAMFAEVNSNNNIFSKLLSRKCEFHTKRFLKIEKKALNFWQLSYQFFHCVCVCVFSACAQKKEKKTHNSTPLVMRHSNNLLGCLSPDCCHCHAN